MRTLANHGLANHGLANHGLTNHELANHGLTNQGLSFTPRVRARTRRSTALAVVSVFALLLSEFGVPVADAARIRDIATFRGMRDNQLVGYGLVVGLDGTGDKKSTGFTLRSMSNLLESVGLTIGPDDMNVKNVAAVMVTASLPPYARSGARLDVTVASIGDAKSLRGGVLIQTPLEGADGQVYAVAQGAVSVGGFSAESPGGTQVSQGQVTVGAIPGGGIVERAVRPSMGDPTSAGANLELVLHRPDYTTAQRIADQVARVAGTQVDATDPGTVRVSLPDSLAGSLVRLMAQIGELEVNPAAPARVVLNERTGTIVAGGNVTLHPVAISHGNLSIRIRNQFDVYQPNSFAPEGTESEVVPYSEIDVEDEAGFFVTTDATSTLDELARALNALGVSPRDLMSIFQALKAAGALDAELIVQ